MGQQQHNFKHTARRYHETQRRAVEGRRLAALADDVAAVQAARGRRRRALRWVLVALFVVAVIVAGAVLLYG